jgi:hypothetical protein
VSERKLHHRKLTQAEELEGTGAGLGSHRFPQAATSAESRTGGRKTARKGMRTPQGGFGFLGVSRVCGMSSPNGCEWGAINGAFLQVEVNDRLCRM